MRKLVAKMVNRKRFIRLASMSFGTLMIPDLLSGNLLVTQGSAINEDLASAALKEARSKGCSYADVRIGQLPAQQGSGSYGVSIRVIVNGSWGHAATSTLTKQGIAECTAIAVASAMAQQKSPVPQRHQYDLKLKHELWSVGLFR